LLIERLANQGFDYRLPLSSFARLDSRGGYPHVVRDERKSRAVLLDKTSKVNGGGRECPPTLNQVF
jgi:hypothetical protein